RPGRLEPLARTWSIWHHACHRCRDLAVDWQESVADLLSRAISPSDPLLAPLKQLPGWSVIHPLTPLLPTKPMDTLPVGDGRMIVSRPVLHCVVSDAESLEEANSRVFEEMKRLLVRLRHVSRQASLPRAALSERTLATWPVAEAG